MGVSSIDIELERSSGVFYAGEVVRGTVVIRNQGSVVKCRGFHIRMTGKARVHWHTGSGDNRTDYDGTTHFVEQRHTLCGNFFKTGLLDNAGTDAYFGKVAGDGIMYIPCDSMEKHNLKLIVRVMDYDWGKKDDLLGEIELDVSMLARSRQRQEFQLTRFNREEKGRVVLSAKFVPSESMFPSTTAKGVTTSSKPLCLILTCHEATGLRKADWVGQNDVYVQAYRCQEGSKRTLRKQLPEPEKNYTLPEGETAYGFAFQIPSDAPGSTELAVSDYAFVRYYLYANVDFAMWRDPSRKVAFSVIPNRPVPTLQLLRPRKTSLSDVPVYGCDCGPCGKCGDNGVVSMVFAIDRSSFAPGEYIQVGRQSVARNDTNKPQFVQVVLVQHVNMITALQRFTHTMKGIVLFRKELGPNTEVTLSSILPSSKGLQVPPVPPSFDGGVREAPTRQRYACLKLSYSLQLQMTGSGSMSSDARVIIPVLIASDPPFPQSIQQASDMGAVEVMPHVGIPEIMQVFLSAVCGPESSDTTPFITGPEDGGQAQPVYGLENGVAIGEIEDGGLLGGPNPYYTPVVNFFDSGSNNVSIATPSTSDNTSAATTQQSTSSDPPMLNTEMDNSQALDLLLKSMDDSYDKRLTVGEWARQHPRDAASLKPDDVERIMGAVSFSLDQPAVAGEIAAAMGRSLTCAHVVAAMRASKYQQVDVAKTMVPAVSDPQNQAIVLDEIEFDFEKSGVAAKFPN